MMWFHCTLIAVNKPRKPKQEPHCGHDFAEQKYRKQTKRFEDLLYVFRTSLPNKGSSSGGLFLLGTGILLRSVQNLQEIFDLQSHSGVQVGLATFDMVVKIVAEGDQGESRRKGLGDRGPVALKEHCR
jgi:hypothetical protein